MFSLPNLLDITGKKTINNVLRAITLLPQKRCLSEFSFPLQSCAASSTRASPLHRTALLSSLQNRIRLAKYAYTFNPLPKSAIQQRRTAPVRSAHRCAELDVSHPKLFKTSLGFYSTRREEWLAIRRWVMPDFWWKWIYSGRWTREGSCWIPVLDSRLEIRMDEQPQMGMGVEVVDPYLRNIYEYGRQQLQLYC